jgi:hypothetical protein
MADTLEFNFFTLIRLSFFFFFFFVSSLSLSKYTNHAKQMDFLNLYEDFLLKNASQITSIESTLRSLTYILPG